MRPGGGARILPPFQGGNHPIGIRSGGFAALHHRGGGGEKGMPVAGEPGYLLFVTFGTRSDYPEVNFSIRSSIRARVR